MAGENQEASIGWGGEAWLSSDETAANLYELSQVTSFNCGSPSADRQEVTHLKSPGRRRQYISGLIDSGEATIQLNTRRGSDTDLAIQNALDTGDERYIRFNYPELGTPVWTDNVLGVVTGYDKGDVAPGDPMQSTVTIAINSVVSSAAYVAPGV